MSLQSDNCTICAEEYLLDELKSVALSAVNVTKFKICAKCLNQTNPHDDYSEVRAIVNSFLSVENIIKK